MVARSLYRQAKDFRGGVAALGNFILDAPNAIRNDSKAWGIRLVRGLLRLPYHLVLRLLRPFVPLAGYVLYNTLPRPVYKNVKAIARRLLTLRI